MKNDIKTKVFLFYFAKTYLAMNEDETAKLLKRQKCPMPFHEDHWAVYAEALTGRKPCPVCSSLTITRSPKAGSTATIAGTFTHWNYAFPDGGVCWRRPTHNFAWRSAMIIKQQFGYDEQHSLVVALGGFCEHEEYLLDCKICMENALRKWRWGFFDSTALDIAYEKGKVEHDISSTTT